MKPPSDNRRYLQPYLEAAQSHGAGFGALLWASPATQAARFDAIGSMVDLNGKSILDVGCGRADLLDHLLRRGVQPADYIGIEAVDVLASAAEDKRLPDTTIIRADFVTDPIKLFVGADVIIFSGSLNTTSNEIFYATLSRAFDATADAVIFNFLCSHMLAGQDYLYWRHADEVVRFASTLSQRVTTLDKYLPGDMTVCIRKSPETQTP